jgi:tRNA (cmo5U34)-methyltransferase
MENHDPHFPKSNFAFDETVAPIFDSMAARSIPGYALAHQHITEYMSVADLTPFDAVWDFGCSTGAGLVAARKGAGQTPLRYIGVDPSQPMLDIVKERYPWVQTIQGELPRAEAFPWSDMQTFGSATACIFAYTLQFMPNPDDRRKMLQQAYAALQPGGMLFVFEKWKIDGIFEDIENQRYWKWRMDNGYTGHEIEHKTEALKGSMWPWRETDLTDALQAAGFTRINQLYRQFMFGGYVAVK